MPWPKVKRRPIDNLTQEDIDRIVRLEKKLHYVKPKGNR